MVLHYANAYLNIVTHFFHVFYWGNYINITLWVQFGGSKIIFLGLSQARLHIGQQI